MQHAVSQEGPDNKALISSCSIIEMQRGIKIAGFLVGVCHCLRFAARCREEGDAGMRGRDEREKEGGEQRILKRNKATQVVLRQHFGGSRDDPEAVKGKTEC